MRYSEVSGIKSVNTVPCDVCSVALRTLSVP